MMYGSAIPIRLGIVLHYGWLMEGEWNFCKHYTNKLSLFCVLSAYAYYRNTVIIDMPRVSLS